MVMYDLDGNETTVNGQTASYDFENHLVSLGSVASYVYDADGNRVSVSSGGTTTSYAVDTSLPYASVIEEYAGTSTVPSARYDYGDDLLRMDRGGVYYLYDGLGSTRQLVSTSGAVTDSYGYSAFGEMAFHTGNTTNPFLFNAQQFDGASGDYFLRARYYDQSNGRFISQDPFSGNSQDPVTLHRYLYANNDPLDYHDPSGREGDLIETSVASSTSATLTASVLGRGLIGAGIGGALGAGDAYLSGGNVLQGAATGAALGFGAGILGAAGTPLLRTILALTGAAGGGGGAYLAFDDGNTALGYYRLILGIFSLFGIKAPSDQYVPEGNTPPLVKATINELRTPEKVDSIKADMLSGDYDYDLPENRIDGSQVGKTYYVGDGHHRMTAATEIFKETGDAKPMQQLVVHGIFPKAFLPPGEVEYDFPVVRP